MPKKLLIQSTNELLDTWGRRNRKHKDRTCETCQRTYRPAHKNSRFCSRPCLWKTNGGHNRKPESWWTNGKGYIEGKIWLPDGTQIRVKKHRFVMEGLIGRLLKPWEDVHHINGVKSDNRPENLQIMPHGEHTRLSNISRIHKRGYKLNLTEEERKMRSYRAIARGLNKLGQAAKAEGREEVSE